MHLDSCRHASRMLYLNEQVAFAASSICQPSAEKVSGKWGNSGNLNWQPRFVHIVRSLCKIYTYRLGQFGLLAKTEREFSPIPHVAPAADMFFNPSSRTCRKKNDGSCQWEVDVSCVSIN